MTLEVAPGVREAGTGKSEAPRRYRRRPEAAIAEKTLRESAVEEGTRVDMREERCGSAVGLRIGRLRLPTRELGFRSFVRSVIAHSFVRSSFVRLSFVYLTRALKFRRVLWLFRIMEGS